MKSIFVGRVKQRADLRSFGIEKVEYRGPACRSRNTKFATGKLRLPGVIPWHSPLKVPAAKGDIEITHDVILASLLTPKYCSKVTHTDQ
jgi:hypothetical protein